MSEEPALSPDKPIAPALAAIASSMLGQVAQGADQPTEAEAVHDIRRGLKRWRAFLRLLEPFLGDTTLRTEAREVARSLAGARDAQAALDALGDLGEDYAVLSPKALASLQQRIEGLRAAAETATFNAAARDRLHALLARASSAVDAWKLDDLSFSDIADRLAAEYRRARHAIPPDWTAADAEALHDLRRRVVAHRYQMELVEPLWPRLGKAWTGEAQRLRDRLGKHQDLAVLAGLTGPHQPLARWRARLAPVITARQKDHIEAAIRHTGRVFAERPRAFRTRLEALWAAQRT
jgi:CHAD domain-containing protein